MQHHPLCRKRISQLVDLEINKMWEFLVNKRSRKRPLKARDHQNVVGKEGNVKIDYIHIYGHKFYQQQNYMEM
jgi:hypothetical protein